MKPWIAALLLFLSFGTASAQINAEALPTTLAGTMKAMSKNMKAVAAQASNPQANADSATLTDQFVQLALHSKNFVPDSIASLPKAQQAEAKTEYTKTLDQAAELGTQLAAAFRANNNALASTLLTQLLQAKKEGHRRFDP